MNTNIITLYSGDWQNIDLEFKDPNEDAITLINCIIKFTVKDDEGNIIIEKTSNDITEIEITDENNGLATIHIIESDSTSYEGVYEYDIQLTNVSGHDFTPIKSYLQIIKDVTI